LLAGLSSVTMRASGEASLGRTKSLGGFEVLAGSGLTSETGGSGEGSLALGFERVARAIVCIYSQLKMLCMYDRVTLCCVDIRGWEVQSDRHYCRVASAQHARDPCHGRFEADEAQP
jgi:hypothetical protein